MGNNNDYYLVLTNLIEELDKEGYKNNSLPARRIASPVNSVSVPSIQIQTSEKAPLVIYDIEIGRKISDEMMRKWKDHASKCGFFYLIVPEEIKEMVDSACAKELFNYIIIPFRFTREGPNRNVVFQFP